ncbi:hypothetical protein [Paraburkholderia sp.]|uniref:hypothetical protein n=1 Tax=Paraburkholderia sp. TaxID=1926495 RepID=UPI003D6E3D2C
MEELIVKKAFLALVAVAAAFGSVSQAFAYDHHHRVCHRVRVHHHWVNRCR